MTRIQEEEDHARDTVTMLLQRDAKSFSPEMWPPKSPDLNPVAYCMWGILHERVYHSQIHDVKELKERLLKEWRLLDHTIMTAASGQWRSRLNACVCVNGGHCEHKFWASDFLLCFVSSILVSVNVIDINMCIVLILCEMRYFCVWHFHTVW